MSSTIAIICHGGAGTNSTNLAEKQKVVDKAAAEGMRILSQGGSAVDAVVKAVSFMEDDPLLNAGTGSYVQMDGYSRMDASIMNDNLDVGAVIQISDVKNPIQVARRIMDLGVHSVLEGALASDFARAQGFPFYDPRTIEKLEIWLGLRKKFLKYSGYELMLALREEVNHETMLSTVGTVARDKDGHLAAGTSTGGLKMDLPGRVGDVPMIGCGTYANKSAAVSCTGIGEKIIKVVLAKTVADAIEGGMNAKDACEEGIRQIGGVQGKAGVICIDRKSGLGYAFNTEAMTMTMLKD